MYFKSTLDSISSHYACIYNKAVMSLKNLAPTPTLKNIVPELLKILSGALNKESLWVFWA